MSMPTPSATSGSRPIVTNSVVPMAKPPTARASSARLTCVGRTTASSPRSADGSAMASVTAVQRRRVGGSFLHGAPRAAGWVRFAQSPRHSIGADRRPLEGTMSEPIQYASPPTTPYALPPGPPPGYRKQMRSHLRHPLENLCLEVVILGSLLVWAISTYEVTSAIIDRRQPDPYAVFFLAAPVLIYFIRGQLYAGLRLSGVKISPTQYPEAHQMLLDACAHHGLPKVPDAYVVLGNGMINAAASGHGYRRFIFVYSDLFEIGGQARHPDALRFIIGHEVGHIAAGHTSYWRTLAISGAQWVPILGSTL